MALRVVRFPFAYLRVTLNPSAAPGSISTGVARGAQVGLLADVRERTL